MEPLLGLCLLHLKREEIDAASKVLESCLSIVRHHYGEYHYKIGILLVHKAEITFQQKNFSESEHFSSKALDILRDSLGEKHDEG